LHQYGSAVIHIYPSQNKTNDMDNQDEQDGLFILSILFIHVWILPARVGCARTDWLGVQARPVQFFLHLRPFLKPDIVKKRMNRASTSFE
jgi:hypothetical protein